MDPKDLRDDTAARQRLARDKQTIEHMQEIKQAREAQSAINAVRSTRPQRAQGGHWWDGRKENEQKSREEWAKAVREEDRSRNA